MNILPIEDRVFISTVKPKETTDSGLTLPESAREKITQGVVKYVGPGKVTVDGTTVPPNTMPGDNVIFPPTVGFRMDVDGEEYLIMKESEIIAIFR